MNYRVPVTAHREDGLAGFKRGRQGRRPYHEPGRTGLRAGHQMRGEQLVVSALLESIAILERGLQTVTIPEFQSLRNKNARYPAGLHSKLDSR